MTFLVYLLEMKVTLLVYMYEYDVSLRMNTYESTVRSASSDSSKGLSFEGSVSLTTYYTYE